MKKLFFIFLFCLSTVMPAYLCANEISFNTPLHHIPLYGEEGENLFPVDKNGFAVVTGVVECPNKSVEQIMNDINQWYSHLRMFDGLEVDNDEKFETRNQLIFKGKLNIGYNGAGFKSISGHEIIWNTSETDLTFIVKIDIKDGKFRYTFSNLKADRYRLPGDAASAGALNDIHWQRINCITAELNKEQKKKSPKKKDIEEYKIWLQYEEYLYHEEFKAINNMVEKLQNCPKEEEFDF